MSAADVDVVDGEVRAENGGGDEFQERNVLEKSDLVADSASSGKKTSKNKRFRRSPSKDESFLKATLLRNKDRHQGRGGKGRGQPKKGGGGGKGTWGKPGSEYSTIQEDIADPDYDSDCQDGFIVQASIPDLTDSQVQSLLSESFLEYFEHGDPEEVICTLGDVNVQPHQTHMALTILINLALDRKATQRELSSVLLSEMYSRLVPEDQFPVAFTSIFSDLPDLTIDTPNAPEVIGQFLARAVADDCLPPKFVETSKEKVESPEAEAALKKAHVLLNIAHGIVRLDNVWGIGGGIRPVKYLVRQIVLLLKEYLSSGDMAEAMRCLTALEVPHFHHEMVYEAVVMVIESGEEKCSSQMCALLRHLASVAVLTPDQITQGFNRVLAQMTDILLDVPAAYTHLEDFAGQCNAGGFLPTAVLKELPTRESRKRYVSEGDGGLVKNGGPQ